MLSLSVCVVMLCYGFVLLCLSSQSFEKWTSLTELGEMLALSLCDRFAEYSFTSRTRPQHEFTFVTQPVACSLFNARVFITPAFTAAERILL